MTNRVGSYLPKGGHQQPKLNLKYNEQTRDESDTKHVTENHIKRAALERSDCFLAKAHSHSVTSMNHQG